MSKTDELAKAYSGIFGDQVVVKRGSKGKIILSLARPRVKKAPSAKQVAVRKRLSLAARYAEQAMRDPALRAIYAKRSRKGYPAFRVAAADFLKMPERRGFNATGYLDNPGDITGVPASDKRSVTVIMARLTLAGGALLEEGPCTPGPGPGPYTYTPASLVPVTAGLVVSITVTETPGNGLDRAFCSFLVPGGLNHRLKLVEVRDPESGR